MKIRELCKDGYTLKTGQPRCGPRGHLAPRCLTECGWWVGARSDPCLPACSLTGGCLSLQDATIAQKEKCCCHLVREVTSIFVCESRSKTVVSFCTFSSNK
ncbi:hypothetical protein CEXT_311501 [Caerostris extrusa]|uniref:Uncharacterized protein n=1 Tax=Caerostris extrusa TaxID=172846 RepID=A0AAV4W4Q6_CAEEX|nr:hypothetical protein CEXT_311501 [Caerostris extrusa]